MENRNGFFIPGDKVKLKHKLDYNPQMYVTEIVKSTMKKVLTGDGTNQFIYTDTLRGIKCRWYTKDGFMQEELFNTKDLVKIK